MLDKYLQILLQVVHILEPILAVHVFDRTIVAAETEELLSQLQHSQVPHHVPKIDYSSKRNTGHHEFNSVFFVVCGMRIFELRMRLSYHHHHH